MKQYIDKSALLAEIEKRKDEITFLNEFANGTKFGLETAIDVINSIEVKEVDLESEWVKYFENRGDMATVNIKHLAKHFFELGMAVSNKAQKGEKV